MRLNTYKFEIVQNSIAIYFTGLNECLALKLISSLGQILDFCLPLSTFRYVGRASGLRQALFSSNYRDCESMESAQKHSV